MSLDPQEFRKEITMFHHAIANLNHNCIPHLQSQMNELGPLKEFVNTLSIKITELAAKDAAHQEELEKLKKLHEHEAVCLRAQIQELATENRQLRQSVNELTMKRAAEIESLTSFFDSTAPSVVTSRTPSVMGNDN